MGSPVTAREWEKTLTVKCRFCGGARCKRCSESAALAKTDSPVRGLHADWVADCVLAMMRPSSRLMSEYQIAQQFHKLNITAVFNLTLPGEHPYCGDGLVASGFPYDPEKDFMAENIRFYNFGWEDMTTPTLPYMMDIVKVVASVLLTGQHKVAVHCHAGYGRTGIVIACALIFMHNICPDLAVRLVRRDRPGSVQTAAQNKFVRDFHSYLNAARVVFALPKVHDRFSLAETVEHQNRRLHGEGHSGKPRLPRVLDFLCTDLERAVDSLGTSDVCHLASALVRHGCVRQQEAWPSTSSITKTASSSPSSSPDQTNLLERQLETIVEAVQASPTPGAGNFSIANVERSPAVTREQLFPIKVAFNVGEWNWPTAAAMCPAPSFHAALLLDWLEHLRAPLLSSHLIELVLPPPPPVVPRLKLPTPPKTSQSRSEELAGDCHSPGSRNSEGGNAFQFQALHQLPSSTMRTLDRVLSCLRVLQARLSFDDQLLESSTATSSPTASPSGTVSPLFDAVCVRTAMALFHLTASAPTKSLRRHADCVLLLVRGWHAPKRLELNMESLQKLSGHASGGCLPHGRRLSRGGGVASAFELEPPLSPTSTSPSLSSTSLSSSPIKHSARESATNSVPSTRTPRDEVEASSRLFKPHKPEGEAHTSVTIPISASAPSSRAASPVKMEPIEHNPSQHHQDVPPLALVKPPPSSTSSSPTRTESRDLSPPRQPTDNGEELNGDHASDSFRLALSARTLELSTALGGTASGQSTPHTNSLVSLPSVRDGERYSRRSASING